MNSRIANAVVFQIGWMVCVLGAGRGRPWLGPVVVSGLVALTYGSRHVPAQRLASSSWSGYWGLWWIVS